LLSSPHAHPDRSGFRRNANAGKTQLIFPVHPFGSYDSATCQIWAHWI